MNALCENSDHSHFFKIFISTKHQFINIPKISFFMVFLRGFGGYNMIKNNKIFQNSIEFHP